jgi:membrane dipeptidase
VVVTAQVFDHRSAFKKRLGKLTFAIFAVVSITACATVNISESPGSNQELTRAVHKSRLVLDAHADIVIASTSLSYMPADKRSSGGVDALVMSVAPGGAGPRKSAGYSSLKLKRGFSL